VEQIENSFDEKTIQKIIKGACIAGTGAAALYILNAIGVLEIDNPVMASFVALMVPFLSNSIKEYLKGVKKE